MAPVKTKRKSQHLPNSNYLSEGYLTIKSRTMVEHWTENSKDLSEEIQISGGGGGLVPPEAGDDKFQIDRHITLQMKPRWQKNYLWTLKDEILFFCDFSL